MPGAIPEPTTELWLWLRTYLDENIWPSTDEAVVLQLANDWASAAQAMTDMIDAASTANDALPGVWPDSAGTIYQRNVARTLDDYRTMVQAYRDMEKLCRDFAGQISALRNSIIAELVVNAALFAALAMFPGAGVLMGRFASQLALRLMGYSRAAVAAMEAPSAMVPHALKFAGEFLAEGAEEVGIDFLGQTMSIAGGYQNGYNVKQMLISGGAGMLGAGLAPVLKPLGQAAAIPAGRITNRLGAPPGMTRTVEQMTSAFVVNGITSPVAGTTVQSLADGRLPTWSDYGHAIVNQAPLAGALASQRIAALNGGVATGNFLRGNGFTLPQLPSGHPPVPAVVGGGPGGAEVTPGSGGPGSTAGAHEGASNQAAGRPPAQSSNGNSSANSDQQQTGSTERAPEQQAGSESQAQVGNGAAPSAAANNTATSQPATTTQNPAAPQNPASSQNPSATQGSTASQNPSATSSASSQSPSGTQSSTASQNSSATQNPAAPRTPATVQSTSATPAVPQNPASPQTPASSTQPNSARTDRPTTDDNSTALNPADPTAADQEATSADTTDQVTESQPLQPGTVPGEAATDQLPSTTTDQPQSTPTAALAAPAAAAAVPAPNPTTTPSPQAPQHTRSTEPPSTTDQPTPPTAPPSTSDQATPDGNPWFDSSVPFGPTESDGPGRFKGPLSVTAGTNEAHWAVGEDGRLHRVTARIREDLADGSRGGQGRSKRKKVVEDYGLDGDNGGHYLGRRFFRNDDFRNLFPQNMEFNKGAYENLEQEWAAWVAEGYEVEVEIVPGPGKSRPDWLTVTYTVLDTRSGQEQAVWTSGATFVNASGQHYVGHLAAVALHEYEDAANYRVGDNEITRTFDSEGVVDTVTVVVREADPRLKDEKQAAGRAWALKRGLPLDADGNAPGHRLFGPGGVAHLFPPGVVIDAEGYAKLEQEWLAQLAAGNEVTITASRLPVPGQTVDAAHLSITATPPAGPSTPGAPTSPTPTGPAPWGPAPVGPVQQGPASDGPAPQGPGPAGPTSAGPAADSRSAYGQASDNFGPVAPGTDAVADPVVADETELFSRETPRTNLEALEASDGLPLTAEVVAEVAAAAGVDLSGVEVVIVSEQDELRYLDYQGACACTPAELGGRQIRLGPASFSDRETLAATLAHEKTHVDQLRAGVDLNSGTLGELEAQAYASESPALERLRAHDSGQVRGRDDVRPPGQGRGAGPGTVADGRGPGRDDAADRGDGPAGPGAGPGVPLFRRNTPGGQHSDPADRPDGRGNDRRGDSADQPALTPPGRTVPYVAAAAPVTEPISGRVASNESQNRAEWSYGRPGQPDEVVLELREIHPPEAPPRIGRDTPAPYERIGLDWAFARDRARELIPPGVAVDAGQFQELEQQLQRLIRSGHELTVRLRAIPGQTTLDVVVAVTHPGTGQTARYSVPSVTELIDALSNHSASPIAQDTPTAPDTDSPAARPPHRSDRFVPGWLLVGAQSSKLLQELATLLVQAGNQTVDSNPLLADLASIKHEGSDTYLIKTRTGETFRLVKRVGPLTPGVQLEYAVHPGRVPVVELRLSDRLTQDEIAPLLARVLAESAAIVRGEVDGPPVFRPDSNPEVDAVLRPTDAGDRAELRQWGHAEQTADRTQRAAIQEEIRKLALAMGVVNEQPNAELLRSLLTQDERAILDRLNDRGQSLTDDRVSRPRYLAKAVLGSGWSAVVLGTAATVFTGNPLVGVGIAVPTIVNALVGSLSERYLDAQKQPGKKPAYVADRNQREFDHPGLQGLLDGPAPVRPERVKVPRATQWGNYLVRYTTPTLATAAVAGALTLFGVPALSTAMVIASSALAKSLAERLVDVKKLEFRLRRVDATERIRLSDSALFANQLITEITELRTRLDRILAALDVRAGHPPAVAEAAQPEAGVTPVEPTIPGAPPFRITLAVQLIENVSAAARRVFVGGDQTVDVDPTELARHVSQQLESLLNAVGPALFGSVTGALGDKYFINREEAANDSRKQWARTQQEAAQAAALAEILAPRLVAFRQLATQLEEFTGVPPDLADRAADRGLPAPTARPDGPRPSGQSHWTAYAIQVAAASLGGAVSAIGLDLIFDLPDLGVVLTVAGAAAAIVGTPVSRYLFRRSEIDLQAKLESILADQAVDRARLLEQQAVTGYLAEQLAARVQRVTELTGQRPVAEAPGENDPRYTDHIRAAVRRAELDNVPPGQPESSYDLDARAERVEALERIDALAAELDRLDARGVGGSLLSEARARLRFAIELYEAIADGNGVRRVFPGLDTVDPVTGRRVVGGMTEQVRFGAEQAVRRLVAEAAGKPLLLERLKALAQLTAAADAVDHQALNGTDESRALVQERFDEALAEVARLWREAGVPNGFVLPAVSVSPGLNRVGGQVVIPLRSVPPVLPNHSESNHRPEFAGEGGRHQRPEWAGRGVLEFNHAQANGGRSLFGPEAAVDPAALDAVEQGLAALVERGFGVEVIVERVARPGPEADPFRFTVRVSDPNVVGPSATEVHGPATLAEMISSLGFDSAPGRHRTEESTGRHHAEEAGPRAQEAYEGRHRVGEPAQPSVDRSSLDDRSDLPGGRHRAPEVTETAEQATPDPVLVAMDEAAARAVAESVAELLPGAIPLQDGGYRATQANGRDVVLEPAALDEVRAEAHRVLTEGNDQQAARAAARGQLEKLLPSATGTNTQPVNPLDAGATRRAAQRIATRAARLAPSPTTDPETSTTRTTPGTDPETSTTPTAPGTDPEAGRTVHAPAVPRTRFVADGRSDGSHDWSVETAALAATAAAEADFGGLIQGRPSVVTPGVVVVQTADGPRYFKLSRNNVPYGRVAATRVRAGSLAKPHLVRMPASLAADQLTRAWVHEISHTLQEQAAPRTMLRRLLRRTSAHTEDACVAAQFNEFRLLSRQLAEASTDEEIAVLRNDIEGLVEAIGRRHQPPLLPWHAPPLHAASTDPVDGFVADVTEQLHDLNRQLAELDHRITAKQEAAERAAESSREAEQKAAEASRAADSGRFARAHQATAEAAKHAEVRRWHEQVATAYQQARAQLQIVADGYQSLLVDARTMTAEQRAQTASELVNQLTAYEQRLADVTPPLIALSSLLPTDWLPHLSALTNQVNGVLAANHVDHRFTPGSLQHRLNAEFGQAVTSDGATLRVGHARPIELRFRLSVSDLIEVLDPSVRASETMLGLLPQPSRKFGITQNGRLGASGAFGLSMLTQLFGEHSWANALGQLVTLKGEQSSGWGRSVTSTGAQYGQDGAVEDNRGESLLYAGQASWQVQARRPGEPGRLLADVTVDRSQTKDRLRAWASHAYTVLAATTTYTNGTTPSGRLPNHTLTSLDGLQSLTDQVFSEYGDQLSDQVREQIRSAITQDLPSRLAESTEQSLLRPLQDNGRPVGHLEVRTEARYEQVELVGDTSTAHWQERVRVGFSNASGQQNFSASTTLNATVGYGGQALTDLGDTSIDLGPSAGAGRSVSRSESQSGGGVGIHVGVQRYTGPTQGYRMVFEHKVTLVLDGESQGTVTGDTEALVRLHTNDAYRHGLPVAESAFVDDESGNRVVENGVPVLRGDPRTGRTVPGRRLELPNWLAGGTGRLSGAGPGLAQRVTGGEQALAELIGPLVERGYLPPLDDQGNPDLARMTSDPLLRQGQLLNLTELRTQLSVSRLEAGYDIAVQSGILVTLTRPVTGQAAETLTLRINLRTGPPTAVAVTNDEAMVTLNIGSDSASRTDGWSKSLPWRASPLGLTQDAPGGATASSGLSYGRQALGRVMGWFTGGTVNQVTLVESRSPVAAFEVPHRLEVTELAAEPVVLHRGTPGTSARVLVDTDLLPSTEVTPTQVSEGPVSDQVLDRATLVALDTHELNRLLQELGGMDPTARHHLAAFLDPRHLLAHPEWARTTYRTDALVRGTGPVSTRGSMAVHGRIGDVVLLGTSDAVVGDINLALTSHGLSAGRSTGGSTSASVGATTDGQGGKLSGEYGTNTSASRTDQTIAGVERLTIEVGRHYLFAGTAGLTVTSNGKPAAADATVVFQLAERDVLRFHVDGELTLPLDQVADAIERYLNGSLELDRRLATGLIRQYRAALATADVVPPVSASHTARALLEKLQPGRPTPRSKAAQLDLVLSQAEHLDATKTVEIPQHYKENLGSSLVEQASVTEQGEQVALLDKVRALVSEQLGIAPDSDPLLLEALAADLAGKRWWGRLEDMLGPDGFARTYPVGQPGQFTAQQVGLRIRAEFTDEAVSLGSTQKTISIVQRYLYDERTAGATSGRSLGAGVDGSLQEDRTGSVGTDRTGSTSVAVGEQTTRLERIATFDGQHRVRRGLKFTVEVTPGLTATPARNSVGRALSRTESPLTPLAPVTLDGEVVQLIPLRMLPETDGPAPQRRTDTQPNGSLNERGVPDAYFVEDAKSNELSELVLRELTKLLGRAGMRVHRPELAVMLSTATLNASFSRMAQEGGFAVLRLPLPGYASQSVEVRVGATVVGAQLVGGPVDGVEIGEVNRSQHTVTHTVTSGRLLPVDGGANLSDAGTGASGGVTAGEQLADQTSDGRGVRRERSRFEKGPVVTARVEVEYDVRLVQQGLRRSGEVREVRETEVEQMPRGVAYLTMFESDYQQLEQFLAGGGPEVTSTVSYEDFEARLRGQVPPLYRVTNLVTDLDDEDEDDRFRSSIVRAAARNPH